MTQFYFEVNKNPNFSCFIVAKFKIVQLIQQPGRKSASMCKANLKDSGILCALNNYTNNKNIFHEHTRYQNICS